MTEPVVSGEAQLKAITGTCGAELLPHATSDDGQPAPVICTLPPHAPEAWHECTEPGTRARWHPRLSEAPA